MSNSLKPHGLYSPWNSPVWNTGVGSLSLLQGIFPAQELNRGLLHCRQILYQLSYQGIRPGNKNCLSVHATHSFLSCILNLGSMLESPGELKKSPHSQAAGFPGGVSGKETPCQCRRWERGGFDPWVRKIPWRRACQSTPVFLPGESHGQRSLVGYSPWGCKESDITEMT